MAHNECGSGKFLLCVALYVVAVSSGNCLPAAELKARLKPSKITGQNNGRLFIGHNITMKQTKATSNPGPSDVDYQGDMGWEQQPQVQGRVEGFSKQGGVALNHLLDMDPRVECTMDSMKLQILDAAPTSGSLFFVDRGSHLSPLPLSKLPASCGYNIHSTQRETVLVAPYDGCFVSLEENSYVLPLRWWGLPVKMSCPMMTQVSTNPPMVTCHAEGMVVKTEWKLSDEIKIKLNGIWESLSSASPRCMFSVVEHPDGLVISLRYVPCLETTSGMYVVELHGEGESRISCPSLSYPAPHPTETPTFYPETQKEVEKGPSPYHPQIPVQPATWPEQPPFVPPRPWSFAPEIPEELPEMIPTSEPFYTQQPTRENPFYNYEKPEHIPPENPLQPSSPPEEESPYFLPGNPDTPPTLPSINNPNVWYFEENFPRIPGPGKPVDTHTRYPKIEESINQHTFTPQPKPPGFPNPENSFLPDNEKPSIPSNPAPETSQESFYQPYPFNPHFFPPDSIQERMGPWYPNVPFPTVTPKQEPQEPLIPFQHPIVPTYQIPTERPGPSYPYHGSVQENTEFPFGLYPGYHLPESENEQLTVPTVAPPTQQTEVPQPMYPYPWHNSKVPEKLHPQWPIDEIMPTTKPEGPQLVYPSPGSQSEDVDNFPSNTASPPFSPSPYTPTPNPTQNPEQPQRHQPGLPIVPTQTVQQPTPSIEQHPQSIIPGGFQYTVPPQRLGNCPELCSVGISYCCPQVTFHQHFHHVVPATDDLADDRLMYSVVPFAPSLAAYGIGNVFGKIHRSKPSQQLPHTVGSSGGKLAFSSENMHGPNLKQYEMLPTFRQSPSQRYHSMSAAPVAQEYQLPENHQSAQRSPELNHRTAPKFDLNSNQYLHPLIPGDLEQSFRPLRVSTPKSDGRLLIPSYMLQNTEASADESQRPDEPQQASSSAMMSEAGHIEKQDLKPKRYTLLKQGPPGRQSSTSREPLQTSRYSSSGNHGGPNRHTRNLIQNKGKPQNSNVDYFEPNENPKTRLNNSSGESVSGSSSGASRRHSFHSTHMKSKIFQSWRTPQNRTASKDSDPSVSPLLVRTSQHNGLTTKHLNQGPNQHGLEIRN